MLLKANPNEKCRVYFRIKTQLKRGLFNPKIHSSRVDFLTHKNTQLESGLINQKIYSVRNIAKNLVA